MKSCVVRNKQSNTILEECIMKNLYKVFLLLFLAAGLVMIGCGGPPPTGQIAATDGTAASGTVNVSWKNCGDGPYDVFRSSSPQSGFDYIGTASGSTYPDATATGDQAYFYKVAPAGTTDYCGVTEENTNGAVDGGYSDAWTAVGVTTLRDACYTPVWTVAFGCNHDNMLSCEGDPGPGLDETYNGSISGEYHVTFELEAGEELLGAVHINFDDYATTCTNTVALDGHQVALVNINTLDGDVVGVVNYNDGACDGWVLYDFKVVAGQGGDGAFYIGDGSTVEYHTVTAATSEHTDCGDCGSGAGDCCTPAECN
jgi:hypothetical protein